MSHTKIKKGLLLLTLASGALAVACELAVDFDRTRIPVEALDAAIPDSAIAETSVPVDGASDAEVDAADAGESDADAAAVDDGGDASDGATDN
jgi:hypothetical protein